MILVTASITNISDTVSTYQPQIHNLDNTPSWTLWSDTLECSAEVMGAGIELDYEAFIYNSAHARTSRQNTETADEPQTDAERTNRYDLAPGETKEVVLPFLVENYTLKNPVSDEKLDLSQFCIQTADYDSATMYRLWLA